MENRPTHSRIVCTILLFFISLLFPLMVSASLFNYAERIDSFKISYDEEALKLPGENFKLLVTVFYKNGKIRTSDDESIFNFLWNRFTVEVNGGEFAFGRVHINMRLLPSKGKYIAINVYPNKSPEMAKHLLLPLNFETDVRLIPVGKIVKAPGYGFKFQIESTYNNGKQRTYSYSRNNRLSDYFNIAVNGGELRKGKFVINKDFRTINKHQVYISVIALNNTNCLCDFQMQLDYKADYHFALSGSSGRRGFDGSDGSDGSCGQNGGNGSCGQNGGWGERGPDIEVWADLYYDSILETQLLYIYARDMWKGSENYYLINPEGGRFFVSSTGGSGGRGGSGGDGGDGGKGADGQRHTKEVAVNDSTTETITYYDRGQNGGSGGSGAYGGCGGNGGDGGNIYIYLTNDASACTNLIIADSSGGWSGNGGSGGSGGSGGNGGSGSPSGSSGHSGSSGCSGRSGSWGWSGNVFYDHADDLVDYVHL